MDIGDNLKTWRTKSGLSQEQVAQKLNISRQAISKWERNINYPDIDTLHKLSLIYNVSMEELITGTKEINSSTHHKNLSNKFNLLNEENIIFHFILIGVLSISCLFPFSGIFVSCAVLYYLFREKLKLVFIIIFCILIFTINCWNSWAFLNSAFFQKGTATITVVAAPFLLYILYIQFSSGYRCLNSCIK